MPKPTPCQCRAVRFPHRPGSVENCVEREEPEERLVSLPGREHFDSDNDYWREALRSL